MNISEASQNIKQLYAEAESLNPTALITLFEIDIGDIGFNMGNITQNEIDNEYQTVFRFHNSIKFSSNTIIWQGKQYIAAPIIAEGFDIKSNGTLPTPKLRLSVSDDGIEYLTIFKDRLYNMGDIVGAKVTRIQTFAKFLDAENFTNGMYPNGFIPSNTEFPRAIFYVDRKSLETKNTIEYELASLFDIENVKLPGRTVVANSCSARYRGHGCLYEYNSRRIPSEHGNQGESILPFAAPAVANDKNEKIKDLLSGIPIVDLGQYEPGIYNSGQTVYITRNNLNYYFVCKGKDVDIAPPNLKYWIPEACSHQVNGCELRYGINGAATGNITLGNLMYNGFISVNSFR